MRDIQMLLKGNEMKKILALATLLTTINQGHASTTTGKITHILSGPGFGTKVFIAVDSTVNEKPECAVNGLYSYGIDSQSPGANTWISMMTVAYTTGKQVWIRGGGSCGHWSSIEDLTEIRLQ